MKVTSFALLALLAICSTASAQLAPQRTWPELKEAVQERANRNAYPMTGMKSEDVREILSQINSLDRDEWAAAWSRMGERYQARAAEQERTDPKAASESYLVAFRYFAFGGWPTPNSAGKKAAGGADEGGNRDIGSFQAGFMRFGAKHNDIYPIIGDMIRWKLGLSSRHNSIVAETVKAA